MQPRLVVSLSGARAQHLRGCAEFAAELDARAVPLSVLVAPAAARSDTAMREWLASRSDSLVLHGFDHRGGIGLAGRWGAEFAALPAHEAGLRLTAARRALETAGLATGVFAAPRWLASRGTLDALRQHGFRVCAQLTGVSDLETGATLSGRVLGFGGGDRSEPWWCFAAVRGAERIARRGGMVRIAVDGEDLGKTGPRSAALDAVDIALHHRARPTTYADLTTMPAVFPATPVVSDRMATAQRAQS